MKTPKLIQNKIMSMIQQLIWGYPINIPDSDGNNDVNSAMNSQIKIGGWNFLKGFISKRLRHAIKKYYRTSKLDRRKYNDEQWMKSVIVSGQDFLLNMWKCQCVPVMAAAEKTMEMRLKDRFSDLLRLIQQRPWEVMDSEVALVKSMNTSNMKNKSVEFFSFVGWTDWM